MLPSALTTRDRCMPVVWLFARAASVLVLGWLLLSGGLVAARGWASATRPLRAGELVVAAIGLAVVACGARTVFTSGSDPSPSSQRRVLPVVVTSLAVVFWGTSLTRDTGSVAAFFWLLLAGEEGWAFWRTAFRDRKEWQSPTSAVGASRDELVLQQFSRLLTRQQEIVRGSLAITVERGSRTSAGHVAFCPPLVERPLFEVQPESTTTATLKVSHVYSHGARIEVRLPQAAQAEATVRVRFVARARRFASEPGLPPAD